jgi:RNA polymerase sigma factor (sigma-70 family)
LAVLIATQPNHRLSARQREQNERLLTKVLQRDEHRLRRQARRHSERPDDVDDIVQSAYLLFLERYKGVGEPLAWLYTTVKREAWAMRRRGSRRRERNFGPDVADRSEGFDLAGVIPTDTPEPAEAFARSELLAERRRALASLKPNERRALLMLGLGFSYAEICQATGWTYTKVNRCVSEGRRALHQREGAG